MIPHSPAGSTHIKRRTITAGLAAGALTAAMVVPATLAGAEPTEPTGDELAGKTVFLDPGHQGSTEGTTWTSRSPTGRAGPRRARPPARRPPAGGPGTDPKSTPL